MALGDFDAAHRLVESMAALGTKLEAPDAAAQVARAIEGLVGGAFMSQAAVHLNSVRDDEFEHVKKLFAAVGPTLVPRLADTLSAETRNRARQRLTELLIAFGAHGRDSADTLKTSQNPSVRRTAVQLLRAFGGPEALAGSRAARQRHRAGGPARRRARDHRLRHRRVVPDAAADSRNREAPRPRGRHRGAGLDARPEDGAAVLLPGAKPRTPRQAARGLHRLRSGGSACWAERTPSRRSWACCRRAGGGRRSARATSGRKRPPRWRR